jgi:hypothetical protein
MFRSVKCDEYDEPIQPVRPNRRASSNSGIKKLKLAILVSACALALAVAGSAAREGRADDRRGASEAVQQKGEAAQQDRIRFDNKVRESFFSGFAGDAAALDQAMKMCEDALAKDPHDAPAMVWHGSGLVFRSGQAFRKGDSQQGLNLWQRGLKEMDDAVALHPTDLQVLIPRGATLLNSSRYSPLPGEAKELLKKGIGDYETVLKIQTPFFSQVPLHSRGELLFGLAEGWYRLGDASKARFYFNRLASDAVGSGRDKQAAEFLKTGELPKNTSCVGCHK